MSKSRIEWLARPGTIPESWNPIAGCTKVSAGCDNCYALSMSWRIANMGKHPARYEGVCEKINARLRWTGRINFDDEELGRPYRWQKERTVFVCSMSDLFHPEVSDDFVLEVFATMLHNRQHTFLVLTKRSRRMHTFFNQYLVDGRFLAPGVVHAKDAHHCWTWPPKHIWLGVTVESARYEDRIEDLVRTPAAVRFLSLEPMLMNMTMDFLELHPYLFSCPECGRRPLSLPLEDWRYNGKRYEHSHGYPVGHIETTPDPLIDQVILGGESGPGARRFNQRAARAIIATCQDAGVAVFVKQLGAYWAQRHVPVLRFDDRKPGRKGQHWEFWPEDLRVREWPQ